ncbi:hypothetical protein BC628DRAFT_1399652 [Trametes gibbosa]|nr:hypothetical protein BC628DRAFT_1399652 [Trametes gibbosa]
MQFINKLFFVAAILVAAVAATPAPAGDVRCVCVTDPCPCAKEAAGFRCLQHVACHCEALSTEGCVSRAQRFRRYERYLLHGVEAGTFMQGLILEAISHKAGIASHGVSHSTPWPSEIMSARHISAAE